jgi:hypothetical protein
MPDETKIAPKRHIAEELKEKADHLGSAVKEGLDSAADKLKDGLHHDKKS